jgi:glycosyltransferase involved in cell wall biosynthesis
MQRLYVVLPAFNEARNIGGVVRDVRALAIPGVALTALVVDDGSKDETARLAEEAGARVLRHPQNRGVGAAFRTGLLQAREDGVEYLVHMDSDGQFLAEDLPRVAEPVLAGRADLSLGSRFVPGVPPPPGLDRWKALALGAVARGVGLLTGYHLTDLSCGLRCMNRKVIDAVNPTFDYDYIQETLIQALAAGARVEDVPVTPLYDEAHVKPGMSSRTLRYGRRFLGLTSFALFNFYKTRMLQR